jgi:hypothetical protein
MPNNKLSGQGALRTHSMYGVIDGTQRADVDAANQRAESLMELVRLQNLGGAGEEARGGCRRCGGLGHLTFECRNEYRLFGDSEGVGDGDASSSSSMGDDSMSDSDTSNDDQEDEEEKPRKEIEKRKKEREAEMMAEKKRAKKAERKEKRKEKKLEKKLKKERKRERKKDRRSSKKSPVKANRDGSTGNKLGL